MRRFLILIGILLLALIAWWTLNFLPQEAEPVDTSTATTTEAVSQWQWEFASAGASLEGVPKTNVTLRNGVTSYAIGAIEGNCFDITGSDWKLLAEEGELAGAICWWAGGGTEIGVFSDGGRALVQIGDVDEGTAENLGVRGNFRPLFVIDFGFIRRLDLASRELSFDNALWLFGKAGEDAAIEAGLCTEASRGDCLPNDFYIYNASKGAATIPLAENITVYMVTWHAEAEGVKRQFIKLDEFAKLMNDSSQHWNQLPYNVTIKNGQAIMIEEVYVP